MADLRKAEKLAAAKKRLKQFQQKRDFQTESGRSTPSKKKSDDDDFENGGSTLSLSHSENLSSNISGTESPVCGNIDNLYPDAINGNGTRADNLPIVSQSLFQTSSIPPGPFNEVSSISAFFDSLSPTANGSHVDFDLAPNLNRVASLNVPNASTPEGPVFQTTPNYSFPDTSVSPIVKNETQSMNNSTREFESKLEISSSRNAELEQQISEQKSQILQLQSHLEDMKKAADESASTLKHHLKAIEILVAEKTELQSALDKRHEEERHKENELHECGAKLNASRHRVSELERELNSTRAQEKTLDSTVHSLNAKLAEVLNADDLMRKRVGDLELEVSDLQSKLEMRDQTLTVLSAQMEKKTSELSLAEVRIQQLSNGGETGVSTAVAEELQRQNELLGRELGELRRGLAEAEGAANESTREYQRYVTRLQADLDRVKAEDEVKSERCNELVAREQQLVARLSDLERQLSRATAAATAPAPADDAQCQQLRQQLDQVEGERGQLREELQAKDDEIQCLRLGLEERALRIQELEGAVRGLEADRPDAAQLQAAIESDKVAASRAVAQNNNLKKQLEELQQALVTLSNNKLELTERLQNEQHLSRDLSQRLETIQESRGIEVDKAQQTERPQLLESTAQTQAMPEPQPDVNPEMMSKLEEKFRTKMSELAELSDEKQRLEHLVLQLQSETETIGEYITLYQMQRGMLRQRAQEKDEQVAQLGRDKEALRDKLAQLNALVQQLLAKQHHHPHSHHPPSDQPPTTGPEAVVTDPVCEQDPTADQIRSLLSEIGSSNLVSTELAFHPCPWCSGRLITV